jgi:hypothetical protein
MDSALGGFPVQEALPECFLDFPRFGDDFEVLVAGGYIKTTGSGTCEWTKSKTSLAEYFKWIGHDTKRVIGGFWAPISKCFGMDRRSLSKGAGNNANPLKPEYSRDFVRIKTILEKHRKKELIKQNEKRIYDCFARGTYSALGRGMYPSQRPYQNNNLA